MADDLAYIDYLKRRIATAERVIKVVRDNGTQGRGVTYALAGYADFIRNHGNDPKQQRYDREEGTANDG